MVGSRGGAEMLSGAGSNPVTSTNLPVLGREVVESFIAIDGRAEVRLPPTEIRIVLAVTSEGKTAQECQTAIDAAIAQLKTVWSRMGIPAEKIVEDFIAILPVYEWSIEERSGVDVGVEKSAGFRMQTNIHVAVPDDSTAARALNAAFAQEVTDIIAFDYWSKELDKIKVEARKQAVKAAREKADLLLTALFDTAPPVINVQEETTVVYPESLYQSFTNTYEQDVSMSGWRRDIPFIRAYRPRNTYYRGLDFDGDVRAPELPLRPEISVVSTVRLYFESGAADRPEKTKDSDSK